MNNKSITKRDVDFAKWYTDVVRIARLASYSSVKGCIIYEPNGYAIWENIQKNLDAMFKKSGHKNVYMPLLIPENLLKKEGELVAGFAPEVAWVTQGGDKTLEERLCIRPTSETLFSDYYSTVVKSYRDLPLKYNQWCNVLRWEKETRPFLRGREFLWQEGHTVHATSDEAEKETKDMLKTYEKFFKEYLAIPVITGKKTEKEKFAGAEYSLSVEALMYNGVCLQSGTSHYFGDKFAKAYDIKFMNKENKQEYAYQSSWGVSTRMIGGLIMVHSDDQGLVLPPKIAPIKVSIIQIGSDEEVVNKANKIYEELSKTMEVILDNTDKSPGFKFSESEVNGIPVRIEVGKRDLANGVTTLVRRDTSEKITISDQDSALDTVNDLLIDIQNNLYNRALKRQENLSFRVNTMDEMDAILNSTPGFITAPWCGDEECEAKVKEHRGCKSRCITDEEPTGKCVVCGKPAKHMVVWGIQY
jgi:prolyl-tRNA synthetase